MLKSFELVPNGDVKHLVVLLHGYGANGEDLIELAYPWQNYLESTAFIAPNAPAKCSESIFGYEWFDLSDYPDMDMHTGLKNSRSIVTEYLHGCLERFNVSPENLVLVGFSQGAMVALDQLYALKDLGGIIGYSGAFYEQSEPLCAKPPVMLVHGTADNIVPYSALGNAERRLKHLGVPVVTRTCQGLGHAIDPYGSHEGLRFIEEIFTKSKPLLTMSSQ